MPSKKNSSRRQKTHTTKSSQKKPGPKKQAKLERRYSKKTTSVQLKLSTKPFPADEVLDPFMDFSYDNFSATMDDIKTMTRADLILGLHVLGESTEGNDTTLRHRLRFASGGPLQKATHARKLTWDTTCECLPPPFVIGENRYTTDVTTYKKTQLARRMSILPSRPDYTQTGIYQGIEPAFLSTFHSIRPDLKKAPGLIEDIHIQVLKEELADELKSYWTKKQIMEDRAYFNQCLQTVECW
jgi:hypothetical protein